MKKFTIAILVAVLAVASVQAQFFFPKFNPKTALGAKGYVVKDNGDKVEGKMSLNFGNGAVTRVVVKKEDGTKEKFKPNQLKSVFIKASKLSKMTSNTGSLTTTLKMDFDKVMKMDYFQFNRVIRKNGKPSLLQLLNPGIDKKIQVYTDPNAKTKTGFVPGVTGGYDKSYYIVKGGGSAGTFIKKSKYKKAFSSIYDCSEMTKKFANPIWKELASHVFYFDQKCGEK